MCSYAIESDIHLFLECEWVLSVYAPVDIDRKKKTQGVLSWLNLFERLLFHSSSTLASPELTAMSLWCI